MLVRECMQKKFWRSLGWKKVIRMEKSNSVKNPIAPRIRLTKDEEGWKKVIV